MKRFIYISLPLAVLVISIFFYKRDKADKENEVGSNAFLEKETTEEKAYRVETTIHEAPAHYSEISKKIWLVEEELRIAQAKIRMSSGNDGEAFVRNWNSYRESNRQTYKKLQELRVRHQLEPIRSKMFKKYGEHGKQYKLYLLLESRMVSGELTKIEFYQQLKKLK